MRIIWLRIKCECCNGLVWGMPEPTECRACGGEGVIGWINIRDRIRQWPRNNAPFVGSWPGGFQETLSRRVALHR